MFNGVVTKTQIDPTAKTYTVVVMGLGYWGAGQTEKEALAASPSPGYLKDRGYVRIDFDQPVRAVAVDMFGAKWEWTDTDGAKTFTETEVEGK